jgi:hypothetical protein
MPLLLWGLILLHDAGGADVYFRASEIMLIAPAGAPAYDKRAHALVTIHDAKVAVRETVEQVREKVEADEK